LTLGTGVGGAIILDGKLFVGHQGAAGELGLITFNPDGLMCKSGNSGSLEQYASISAIRRRTGKEPSELGALAAAGDIKALTFWQEYGKDLGIGLASLIYVLTPQAIILGGGISASFEFFFPAVKAEIEQRVMFTSRVGLQILPAQLGNSAGMVGAAKLVISH
jgi:glucokinase